MTEPRCGVDSSKRKRRETLRQGVWVGMEGYQPDCRLPWRLVGTVQSKGNGGWELSPEDCIEPLAVWVSGGGKRGVGRDGRGYQPDCRLPWRLVGTLQANVGGNCLRRIEPVLQLGLSKVSRLIL